MRNGRAPGGPNHLTFPPRQLGKTNAAQLANAIRLVEKVVAVA